MDDKPERGSYQLPVDLGDSMEASIRRLEASSQPCVPRPKLFVAVVGTDGKPFSIRQEQDVVIGRRTSWDDCNSIGEMRKNLSPRNIAALVKHVLDVGVKYDLKPAPSTIKFVQECCKSLAPARQRTKKMGAVNEERRL